MKMLVIGAALFISGMIGISSIIISCASVIAGGKPIGILFRGSGFHEINLATPLVIFIFLMLFGVVFAIGGFRDKN